MSEDDTQCVLKIQRRLEKTDVECSQLEARINALLADRDRHLTALAIAIEVEGKQNAPVEQRSRG